MIGLHQPASPIPGWIGAMMGVQSKGLPTGYAALTDGSGAVLIDAQGRALIVNAKTMGF